MQQQKKDIRQRILDVSKQEFFKHGFNDASMRNIAKKAGVGLSNIYNYFHNKDDLLRETLAPLLMAFDKMFDEHNTPEKISLDLLNSEEFLHNNIDMLVNFVAHYRDELNLLLFHAHGSSLENFRDEFTRRYTKTSLEYLAKMKKKYPDINGNVSTFFMHTAGSWWLSTIGEIVTHNELSRAELEQFIAEYMIFGTAGWRDLMGAVGI